MSFRRLLNTIVLFLLSQQAGVLGFNLPIARTCVRCSRHPISHDVSLFNPQSTIQIFRPRCHYLFSADTQQQIDDSDHQDNPLLGDKGNGNNPLAKASDKLRRLGRQNKRNLALSILGLVACSVGFARRRDILAFLATWINLNEINQWLQNSLNDLNRAGTVGLVFYAILFCFWTMTVGVTTPVETAAGFAFGAKRAILANAFGKSFGALTAFFLGRFIFKDAIRKNLQNNEVLQLVEESITDLPLLVALMVRLSPLPELVKNMGMSVLDIKSRYFALSVLLHGFPFTCLWTVLGAETAKVVTLGVHPSTTLKVLVSGSTWFGVIISPALIAWWLNTLRAKRAKRQAEAGSNFGL